MTTFGVFCKVLQKCLVCIISYFDLNSLYATPEPKLMLMHCTGGQTWLTSSYLFSPSKSNKCVWKKQTPKQPCRTMVRKCFIVNDIHQIIYPCVFGVWHLRQICNMAVNNDETLTAPSVTVSCWLSSMSPAPPNLETKGDRIRDVFWGCFVLY